MDYNQYYENGATSNKIPISFKIETGKTILKFKRPLIA